MPSNHRSLDNKKLNKIIGWMTALLILGAIGGYTAFIVYGLQYLKPPEKTEKLGNIQNIEVYFSPTDKVQDVIIKELSKARETIDCSLYGITQDDLAGALIARKRNGVRVRIGEDKMQAAGKSDKHELLQANGIEVVIKKTSALEHNKYCIIDGKTVFTGSYNASFNASKQDNNFLIIRDSGIANKFENNFEWILRRDR